jgi:hypothetical protein
MDTTLTLSFHETLDGEVRRHMRHVLDTGLLIGVGFTFEDVLNRSLFDDQRQRPPVRLKDLVPDILQTCLFENVKFEKTCPICIEDFTGDDKELLKSITSCGHTYHNTCIKKYLSKGFDKCAVCSVSLRIPKDSEPPNKRRRTRQTHH